MGDKSPKNKEKKKKKKDVKDKSIPSAIPLTSTNTKK